MDKLGKTLKKITDKKMPKKHFCLWLKTERGWRLQCWQKGKRIKKSECTPCLLARLVQSTTYLEARQRAEKRS